MADPSRQVERRIDLDWIRIAAFGSLILYHVGMVFVPWYYHVKSTHIIPALEPLMLLFNPWRLSLLFLVAGTATRFMFDNTAPLALLGRRSSRLLPPLLFGMLVIVPPQSYWEVVSRHLYDGGFLAFYTGPYLAFAHEFCRGGPCIILPTWNHLWFVAYLWLYTVVLMLLVSLQPVAVRRMEARLAYLLSGIWLLVIPLLLFGFYRLVLFPQFPPTNAMVGDWYNHAQYFSMFVLGFLIARSETVWDTMMQWRWVALVAAAVVFASYLVLSAIWPAGATIPFGLKFYQRAAYGLYQWCCIVAILGFGRRWIRMDSAAHRYLTDAIFPYYIVHQTVIVGVAFALRDAGLPAAIEAVIIIVATVVGCALSYEIIRRISWLRPLFGLKPQISRA
jgi:hypothetical protein